MKSLSEKPGDCKIQAKEIKYNDAVSRGLDWLDESQPGTLKEYARSTTASYLWGRGYTLTATLIKEIHRPQSFREICRGVSALATMGIYYPAVTHSIKTKQKDGNLKDIYDRTYALIALADLEVSCPDECQKIIKDFDSTWEHPGTIALIIICLIKQSKLTGTDHTDFTREKTDWLLSRIQDNGGWKFTTTSNLVMQALIIAGRSGEIDQSIKWLLKKQNDNGSWGKNNGDITATAQSLITLALYINA
ncbi:prenyltransferase/squalene oxidase repeat-containing protein [Methanohalophilus halophilus]|uniref:Terpene cyclase/mutase family protein n=1 Tax=Methanohalophilus halophilus TaxID=2177 RepID=A0A1H2Q9L0_9EURY|nr:prenyltransferase/squalene oxidase repeat-containing protein [Methanohalophilus halophilus]RNI10775.1 hypothetical protein EFE40_00910 [Methanohalophilus halophilus]SDW03841.1 hypothetical protein SAMN04515625_0200 [Methanohalophilus halophilus]